MFGCMHLFVTTNDISKYANIECCVACFRASCELAVLSYSSALARRTELRRQIELSPRVASLFYPVSQKCVVITCLSA